MYQNGCRGKACCAPCRSMADNDFHPGTRSAWPLPPPPLVEVPEAEPTKFQQRYWLHALLFVLTVYSTTLVGARLSYNFQHNLPAFDLETDLPAYLDMLAAPSQLVAGLPFSLVLMTILLAHEFGHYLACVHYRVNASLPYFIPAPTLI